MKKTEILETGVALLNEIRLKKVVVAKTDIARRQIDAAIRTFFHGGDPIIVASLFFPASQILRDLNNDNPKALSNAITEVLKELNCPSGKFWSGFNQAANTLKHASRDSECVNIEKIASNEMLMGGLAFCVFEFNARVGGVSPHMAAFVFYVTRRAKREHIACWARRVLDRLDRHLSLRWADVHVAVADARLAFSIWLLSFLIRAKSRLEQQRANGVAGLRDE